MDFLLTVSAESVADLIRDLRRISRPSADMKINVVSISYADGREVSAVEAATSRPSQAQYAERNSEIVAAYESDPKANSTGKLSDRYGISRERICQILRPTLAIATAHERREAARSLLAEESARLKSEAESITEDKLAEALDHMREGKSARQSAVDVGMDGHHHFVSLLGKRARSLGIKNQHGRWRDFSARKDLVRKYAADGLSISQIVQTIRSKHNDRIHIGWIYGNMPEIKKPTHEANK